jgi:hypothetical protein
VPPPLPKSRISINARMIELMLNPSTKIVMNSSGITLEAGGAKLVIGSGKIKANPMVEEG